MSGRFRSILYKKKYTFSKQTEEIVLDVKINWSEECYHSMESIQNCLEGLFGNDLKEIIVNLPLRTIPLQRENSSIASNPIQIRHLPPRPEVLSFLIYLSTNYHPLPD